MVMMAIVMVMMMMMMMVMVVVVIVVSVVVHSGNHYWGITREEGCRGGVVVSEPACQ